MSIPVIAYNGRLSRSDLVAITVFAVLTGLFLSGVIAASRSQRSIRRTRCHAGSVLSLQESLDAHCFLPPPIITLPMICTMLLCWRANTGLKYGPWQSALLPIRSSEVSLMWFVMEALGANQGFHVALVTYAIATTFSIVGFIPAGIGFAELSMAATLLSYGGSGGKDNCGRRALSAIRPLAPIVGRAVSSTGADPRSSPR